MLKIYTPLALIINICIEVSGVFITNMWEVKAYISYKSQEI